MKHFAVKQVDVGTAVDVDRSMVSRFINGKFDFELYENTLDAYAKSIQKCRIREVEAKIEQLNEMKKYYENFQL